MKIIEDNYTTANFSRRITCEFARSPDGYYYDEGNNYCGSVLEIEASDVKRHNWAKYYRAGTSYVVVCPLCGCWIELDPDTLPRVVKEKAEPIQRGRR